jgi:hypothetical protein
VITKPSGAERIFTDADSGGWKETTDFAMHARIAAAISLIFEHETDPRAVRTEKAQDGSYCRDILFDSSGQAACNWEIYEGKNPAKAHPFSRADYRRTSDGVGSAIAAYGDGRTVLFSDGLGYGPAEELTAALERFAQHVATGGARKS